MPDIIDLGPLQPDNAAAELEARNRLEAQRESASADEIINGALLTTIPATIVRHLQRASIPADSSFELTPTMIKEASQDLDPDLAKKMIDADSQEELGIIRGQMVFEQQRRDALRRAGWVGTAATIGANVLDPVQLASGALTMGATSAGRLAGAIEAGLVNAIPQVALDSYQVSEQTDRGTGDVLSTAGAVFGLGAAAELARGAGALKGALIAGAGGAIGAAAVETPRALFDQDRSTRDLLYAVAGNFAFGSTIGALGNAGRKTQAVAELYDIAEAAGKVRGSTVDVSGALTPKGRAYYRENLGSGTERLVRLADDLASAHLEADAATIKAAPYAPDEVRYNAPISAQIDEAMLAGELSNVELQARDVLSGNVESFNKLKEAASRNPSGWQADEVKQIELAIASLRGPERAMGAATQQSIYPPPQAVVPRMTGKLADDFDLGGLTDAKAAFAQRTTIKFGERGFVAGITRWDMPGMLGGSEIDEFRALANAIAPDSLAKAGDLPTIETAPVWVQSRHSADIGTAWHTFDRQYEEYADAAFKAGRKVLTSTEFDDEVSKVRRRGIPAGTDPVIAKAATEQAKRFEQYLEQAKRHKVVGADQIGAELEYVPRVPAKAKLDEAMSDQAIRRSGIITTVENAIRAKQPNLSPQKVSEIAEDWVTNFQDDSIFSADHFTAPKPGEPWTPRLKRRVEMDETLRTTLPSGKTLAVEDLLENNARVLEGMYNLSLLHASARQEVFRAMSLRLGKDIGSTDTLLNTLEEHAKDQGFTKADYESDLTKLEHLMRHAVEGLPTTDYNAPGVRTMRLVRDLNFFKALSGVGTGIQNITEIVPALSQAGGRAALRQLPALEAALRAQIAGQAADDLTIALHAMTGVGMDRTLRRILPRATDADTPGANFTANRAERAVKRLTRFAGDVSLQNHGQQWMQDVTGSVVLQRWLDDALKDRVRTQRYYAGLGISPDEARRIEQQIKAHAVTTKTWAGTKIVDPNYRAWGDQEAAAKFRYTVTRETNRLVLTNNPAAYSKWMTTETGKMLAQFRTFGFGAWTNKVLYGVQQRDLRTWISVVLGFATSAAGYTLARLQDSVGKPDAEEYRAKMLNTEAIVTAAFGRSAYSSLIPGTVDAVVGGVLQREPIFSHARSSGLASGGLKSIPIVDYGDRLARAVGGIQAPFTEDYYFSQQDLRNLEEALFVPRLVGLRNVIEQLGSSLPESSRE